MILSEPSELRLSGFCSFCSGSWIEGLSRVQRALGGGLWTPSQLARCSWRVSGSFGLRVPGEGFRDRLRYGFPGQQVRGCWMPVATLDTSGVSRT